MISTRNRPCRIINSIRVAACTFLFSSVIASVVNAQPKNIVVANITVGNNPGAVVVSPNNAYVYVANFDDNTVSVINATTNAVIATIGAGTRPDSVAVTPDGSALYVADDFSGKATVINTGTDTKITSVPVRASPLSLAVSPDGTSVFACFYSGIKVIDTKNHRITATIPLNISIAPIQVLFNPDNKLAYALCYDGFGPGPNQDKLGGILQIKTQTLRKTRLLWKQLPNATSVAASPDGSKLYIVDFVDNVPTPHADLVIFDTASQQIQTTVSLDPSLGPRASAITPDGKYLYLTANFDRVLMFDTATNTVDASISLAGAWAIAISPNGNYAYVVSTGPNGNPGSVTVIDISSN
ncbi:MAG TPA: YncE family protein [Chthoniobacterales bacterium]